MSSPRAVARIVHKTARLRARPGYAQPRGRRARFSGDVGPRPVDRNPGCDGKVALSMMDAAARAERLGLAAYPCPVCRHWHVGHP